MASSVFARPERNELTDATTSLDAVPRITALRDRPGAVAVELDGVPWRTIPVEVAARTGLSLGRELDRPLARELARALRRSSAFGLAGRALRARDRSRRELEDRLARGSVPPATRAEALATLERAGLVDDVRFAAGRARALVRRGLGDAAIRHELEHRGFPAAAIEAAFAELESERERGLRLVERRGRTAATARYLAARGFEPDVVEDLLGGEIAGDA